MNGDLRTLLTLLSALFRLVLEQNFAGEVYGKPTESMAPSVNDLVALLICWTRQVRLLVNSFYYEAGQLSGAASLNDMEAGSQSNSELERWVEIKFAGRNRRIVLLRSRGIAQCAEETFRLRPIPAVAAGNHRRCTRRTRRVCADADGWREVALFSVAGLDARWTNDRGVAADCADEGSS